MVSNEIYVSPGKFPGITIDKKKQNHTVEYISIDQKNIKTSSSVKLLGLHIDNKLNFNLYITKICRSAANQLHALIKLRVLLNFEEKKTLINSCFCTNCNYCPIVWMFSSVRVLDTTDLKFGIVDPFSPFHMKSSENLEAFKNIIKNWNGVSCKCKVCKYH